MLYRPPKTTNAQRVHEILDGVDGDIRKAAAAIYAGDKDLALCVLEHGIRRMRHERNNKTRKRIHNEIINPKFVQRRGGVSGSVVRVRTKREQQRVNHEIASVWAEYNIGSINLGTTPKEQMLAEAAKERASGKGHFRNAEFLERLAEPLRSGGTCPDYWTTRAVDILREEIWRDDKAIAA